jgi:hypothetical protein
MIRKKPIIAIVGSIRENTVDKGNEGEARMACRELGQRLAEKGLGIAVYSSDLQFIEPHLVAGYVASGKAKKESIICYYPQGQCLKFSEMAKDDSIFRRVIDSSTDWEISYYRSLANVNGVLILGGGYSTLITGLIALSMEIPTVSISHFGGEAKKIWKHIASKPGLIEEEDVQAMATWTSRSAEECVNSLLRQHKRLKKKISREQNLSRNLVAGTFLLGCLIFTILGLSLTVLGWLYTAIVMSGLCISGGAGATIRLLTPDAPSSNISTSAILGVAAGFISSLLYLIPHLAGESSFIVQKELIVPATRIQYLSAIVVAFLAGLAFDFFIERLLEKARERTKDIVTSAA